MSEIVTDCPRCGAELITFDCLSAVVVETRNWQKNYEGFCVCRFCKKATIFNLAEKSPIVSKIIESKGGLMALKGSISGYVGVNGFVTQKDIYGEEPPEHLPVDVERAFREGATCFSIGCHNAAGTMFRLCIDLATRPLLPQGEASGLTHRIRRDLGLRLPWLFDNGLLPVGLRDLSVCIREDGNDGAHSGTLTAEDSEDLLDFTDVLLERMFTEPKRIEIAKERREQRRIKPGQQGSGTTG